MVPMMPHFSPALATSLALPLTLLLSACGDGSVAYQPAGTVLPTVAEADSALAEQVATMDQVEGVIGISHGFAAGEPAAYWTLGSSPAAPQRVGVLCRPVGDGCDPIDHPLIFETLPGEEGYSHFGRVTEVQVTDAYAGEVLGSFEAIEDAAANGLAVLEERNAYLNCPIVAPDVELATATGGTRGPRPVHVRDMRADCLLFDEGLGRLGLGERGTEEGAVRIRNVYVLSREGEDAPLIEAMQMTDLTGDGDQDDSNTILGVDFDDPLYTPLWQMVRVTVPTAYASIDTSMDQTVADYRAAEDMFTIDPLTYEIMPIEGQVVDHEVTEILVNCPVVP